MSLSFDNRHPCPTVVGFFCNVTTVNQELRPSANFVVKDPLFGFLPRKKASPSRHGESIHLSVSVFLRQLMLQLLSYINVQATYTRVYWTTGSVQPNERILRDGTQTLFECSEGFRLPSWLIFSTHNQVLIIVGEAGSGKTAQYVSFTVLKSSLMIDFQDTSICCLFGSSSYQRQNRGMYQPHCVAAAMSAAKHVVKEIDWCVQFSAIAHSVYVFAYREGNRIHDSVWGYDITFLKYMMDGTSRSENSTTENFETWRDIKRGPLIKLNFPGCAKDAHHDSPAAKPLVCSGELPSRITTFDVYIWEFNEILT